MFTRLQTFFNGLHRFRHIGFPIKAYGKQLCIEKHVSFVLKGNYLLRWTLLGAVCPTGKVVISVSYSKRPHGTIYCEFWLWTIHSGNTYCLSLCQVFFKVLGMHQRIRDLPLF